MDDDPLQAFVYKSILEKRFEDVLRVADAAEALCLIEQPKFSAGLGLVVSKHNLAGIGGPAFVAELHTRMPSLPVVVLGDENEDHRDYAGELVHFLPRPIVPDDLMSMVRQLLAQYDRKTA